MEELADQVGRRRSTLQTWLRKFQAGGLAGLLERDAAPGVSSPLGAARVQRQLQAGLQASRWTSAAHVAAWLEETHGISRSRKSIYRARQLTQPTPRAWGCHRRVVCKALAKPPPPVAPVDKTVCRGTRSFVD